MDIGTPPQKLTEAMAVVKEAAKKPWDKAGIDAANAKLKELGYKDLNAFADGLAIQFEALKLAKKR